MRPFEKDIVLVGMMGVGKSTIAKILASEYGYQLVDTDVYIEQKEGKTIKEYFKNHTEEEFREVEKKHFKDLALQDEIFCRIISTGGGIVIETQNREILKNAPIVIWLKKDIEIILNNISDHALVINRPLLTKSDLREKWQAMYDERKKYYQEVTTKKDYEIDCNKLDPWQVYLKISEILGM